MNDQVARNMLIEVIETKDARIKELETALAHVVDISSRTRINILSNPSRHYETLRRIHAVASEALEGQHEQPY